MINLSLDHHDFLFAVEGFARGSHLRQHVWRDIVYKSIPQMSDDDMDFLWFFMRRDLWSCYFYELNGKEHTHFGYEDFVHALAALHRGNRYMVKFRSVTDNKLHYAICYRFNGLYRPIYLNIGKNKMGKELQHFYAIIPSYWIKVVVKQKMPENRYVEQGKEYWWNDLEIYDALGNKVNNYPLLDNSKRV